MRGLVSKCNDDMRRLPIRRNVQHGGKDLLDAANQERQILSPEQLREDTPGFEAFARLTPEVDRVKPRRSGQVRVEHVHIDDVVRAIGRYERLPAVTLCQTHPGIVEKPEVVRREFGLFGDEEWEDLDRRDVLHLRIQRKRPGGDAVTGAHVEHAGRTLCEDHGQVRGHLLGMGRLQVSQIEDEAQAVVSHPDRVPRRERHHLHAVLVLVRGDEGLVRAEEHQARRGDGRSEQHTDAYDPRRHVRRGAAQTPSDQPGTEKPGSQTERGKPLHRTGAPRQHVPGPDGSHHGTDGVHEVQPSDHPARIPVERTRGPREERKDEAEHTDGRSHQEGHDRGAPSRFGQARHEAGNAPTRNGGGGEHHGDAMNQRAERKTRAHCPQNPSLRDSPDSDRDGCSQQARSAERRDEDEEQDGDRHRTIAQEETRDSSPQHLVREDQRAAREGQRPEPGAVEPLTLAFGVTLPAAVEPVPFDFAATVGGDWCPPDELRSPDASLRDNKSQTADGDVERDGDSDSSEQPYPPDQEQSCRRRPQRRSERVPAVQLRDFAVRQLPLRDRAEQYRERPTHEYGRHGEHGCGHEHREGERRTERLRGGKEARGGRTTHMRRVGDQPRTDADRYFHQRIQTERPRSARPYTAEYPRPRGESRQEDREDNRHGDRRRSDDVGQHTGPNHLVDETCAAGEKEEGDE